ncbi:MAG: hypothetical protein ACLQUY_05225, partial [Ktedonobacterales bacterium]
IAPDRFADSGVNHTMPFWPTVVSSGVLIAVAFAVSKAWLSRTFLDGIVRMFLSGFPSLRRAR